jgi:hypothetical protein
MKEATLPFPTQRKPRAIVNRTIFWLIVLALEFAVAPNVVADTLATATADDYVEYASGPGSYPGTTVPAVAVYANYVDAFSPSGVEEVDEFTGCAITAGSGYSSPCGLGANPAGPVTALVLQQDDEEGPVLDLSGVAQLTYYAQVNGPAASNIPLIVGGSLFAVNVTSSGSSGTGSTSLLLAIADQTQNVELVTAEAYAGGTEATANVAVNQTVSVNSGDLLQITMDTNATLSDASLEAGMIDPFLEIDPSFSSAGEYSVDISPGIGNPLPESVPEPASLLLFSTALMGLGGVRSRRAKRLYERSAKSSGDAQPRCAVTRRFVRQLRSDFPEGPVVPSLL